MHTVEVHGDYYTAYVVAVTEKTWWKTSARRTSHHDLLPDLISLQQGLLHLPLHILVTDSLQFECQLYVYINLYCAQKSVRWQNRQHGWSLVAHDKVKKQQQYKMFLNNAW